APAALHSEREHPLEGRQLAVASRVAVVGARELHVLCDLRLPLKSCTRTASQWLGKSDPRLKSARRAAPSPRSSSSAQGLPRCRREAVELTRPLLRPRRRAHLGEQPVCLAELALAGGLVAEDACERRALDVYLGREDARLGSLDHSVGVAQVGLDPGA